MQLTTLFKQQVTDTGVHTFSEATETDDPTTAIAEIQADAERRGLQIRWFVVKAGVRA